MNEVQLILTPVVIRPCRFVVVWCPWAARIQAMTEQFAKQEADTIAESKAVVLGHMSGFEHAVKQTGLVFFCLN